MARKRVVKRSKSSRSGGTSRGAISSNYKKKFLVAWKNFLFFTFAAIIFFVLYELITNILLKNFFGVLATISGIIAFALLIVFIVFAILKSGRK